MSDNIEDKVREKVQSLVQEKNIEITNASPLVTSGLLSSLRIVELATWLEQTYQVDFSTQHFNVYAFETVLLIVDLIQKRA
jgi:acyl carrier protein